MLGQYRDAPPLEIERPLVELAPVVERPARHMEQQGLVERALEAGLEPRVHCREFGHALVVIAVETGMTDQRDARFGQRAGLVGAQYVHLAEIVDRRQPLHHHPRLRHALRAAGKRHGHDHRQQFGRQAHRQRHREQEGLERRPTEREVRQ